MSVMRSSHKPLFLPGLIIAVVIWAITMAPHVVSAEPAPPASAMKIAAQFVAKGNLAAAALWYAKAVSAYRAAGDGAREAEALASLANVHEALGHFQLALDYDQRAMAINSDLNERRAVAVDEGNVARVYDRLGQPAKAMAADIEAARIYGDLKEPSAQILELDRAAHYSQQIGDFVKAMECCQEALILARASNSNFDEESQLSNIAAIFEAVHQPDKALDYRQQALSLARSLGNMSDEASELESIGRLDASVGRYSQALPCCQEASGLYEYLNDQPKIAIELGSLADLYEHLGPSGKVVEYRKLAISAHTVLSDIAGAVQQLNALAGDYQNLGNWVDALASSREAFTLCGKLNDKLLVIDQLTRLGDLCAHFGRNDSAMHWYRQALQASQSGRAGRQGRYLLACIGDISMREGHPDTFLEYRQRVLALDLAQKDAGAQSLDLAGIASGYMSAGKYDKALDYYGRALAIDMKRTGAGNKAADLHAIGEVYERMGKHAEAVARYRMALAVNTQMRDVAGEAADLASLGSAYAAQGELQAALNCDNDAIARFRDTGNTAAAGLARISAGRIYCDRGEYSLSIETVRAGLADLIWPGYPRERQVAYCALSRDLAAQGQLVDASKSAEQALALDEQLGDKDGALDRLGDIGDYYERAGLYDNALAIDKDLLNRAKVSGNAVALARSYENFGIVATRLGKFDAASDWFARALALQESHGDLEGQSSIYGRLMALCAAWGQPRLAITLGKAAVNDIETVGPTHALPQEEVEWIYHTLDALLLDQLRIPEALQVWQLLKHQELSAFVGNERSGIGSQAGAIDYWPEEKLAHSSVDRLMADVVRPGALKSGTQNLHEFFSVGARSIFSDSTTRSPGRLADIARSAKRISDVAAGLGPGVVKVYTILEPDGRRYIIVSSSGVNVERCGGSNAVLCASVQAWRDQLTNLNMDPRSLGATLYRGLFAAIKSDLEGVQANTILWSLDASLRGAPMAALYDNGKYLAEQYRNVVLSGSDRADDRLKPQGGWVGDIDGLEKLWTPPQQNIDMFIGRLKDRRNAMPNESLSAAVQFAQLSILHGDGQDAAYAHPFYWAAYQLCIDRK